MPSSERKRKSWTNLRRTRNPKEGRLNHASQRHGVPLSLNSSILPVTARAHLGPGRWLERGPQWARSSQRRNPCPKLSWARTRLRAYPQTNHPVGMELSDSQRLGPKPAFPRAHGHAKIFEQSQGSIRKRTGRKQPAGSTTVIKAVFPLF